jgi:hypothetical protein
MTTLVKAQLEEIFGHQMPDKTTSFHTIKNTAVFMLVHPENSFICHKREVEMMPRQVEALAKCQLLGPWGWSLLP